MAEIDDALFWDVAESYINSEKATEGTLMNTACVRVRGEFVAMPDHKLGHLIAKLPASRVAALIAAGDGAPFGPGGKVFKEWVLLAERNEALWKNVFDEAVTFGDDNANKKSSTTK